MAPSLTSVIENNNPSEKISEIHCKLTGMIGVIQVNYTPTMVMLAAAAIPAITIIIF
jgi:energy-converting hydrogenase Eha subunit C